MGLQLLALLVLAAATPVPPVPPGAAEGDVVEVDGALWEVQGDHLVPWDEDGIAVTGSRLDTRKDGALVRTDRISAEEIRERGAQNLGDVLEGQAGVQVNSSLGLGKTVVIDGLEGKDVLILIDGRPVNGRVDNTVDVSRIPISAADIDHIEIVRGPMSALYGSEALGGVVNIVTKRPKEGLHGEVELTSQLVAQRTLWSSLTLNVAGDLGPVAARADLATSLAPSTDRQGRVTDGDHDVVVLHPDGHNDTPDRRQFQAGLEVDVFTVSDWTLTAQARGSFEESAALLAPAVPFRDHAENGEVTLSTTLAGDVAPGHTITLDVSVDRFTHRFEKQPFGALADLDAAPPAFCAVKGIPSPRFFDPECPAAPVPRTVAQQAVARFEARYAGQLLAHLPFADELSLGAGAVVEREHDARVNQDGDDTIPGGADRAAAAVYAEVLWRPVEWLSVSPGGRLDLAAPGANGASFGAAFGPKLSSRVDLPAGFAVRASYGEGFRLPSFTERFLRFDHSELGYVVEGNPDLRPEKSHGGRAEVVWTLKDHVDLGVEGYLNLLDDLISESPRGTTESGAALYVYENTARAYTSGLNLHATVTGAWGFSVDTGYQYLINAVDASLCPAADPWFCARGTSLPLRAAHAFHGKVRYQVAATATTLFTTLDALSERPLGLGAVAPGFLQAGVGVRQPLGDHAEVLLTLDNLLDAYDPTYGPKPGRHATATLRGSF